MELQDDPVSGLVSRTIPRFFSARSDSRDYGVAIGPFEAGFHSFCSANFFHN